MKRLDFAGWLANRVEEKFAGNGIRARDHVLHGRHDAFLTVLGADRNRLHALGVAFAAIADPALVLEDRVDYRRRAGERLHFRGEVLVL